MKVLLISIGKTFRYSNPGIDLLAGYLRSKNYNVDIMYFHQKESYEEIVDVLPVNYDVIGMSVYSSNYSVFLELSLYLKKNSNAWIIWGGAFPSMYYRDIFKASENIDYIILGDGEKPFEFLLEKLRLEEICFNHESIASRYDFENKKNFCNREIDYLPVFDYYENVLIHRNKEKIHCIQTKNNVCTGNCSFCYERKGKISYKSLDLIAKEIKYVYEKFGVRKFYFADDNLLDPNNDEVKDRIKNLCYLLQEYRNKVVFTCYIKAISFNNCKEDSELLSLMRLTGFTTMFIGIESGNNEDLKLYNKYTSVSDNIQIITLLKKHNIIPMVGFININPYSTLEKLKKNYYFLLNIESINLFSYGCSFLNLYKGTSIYDKVVSDNLLTDKYTIFADTEYGYYDESVVPVANFVKNELAPRILALEVETSWLIQRCEDSSVINVEAEKYREILEEHAKEEFILIKKYFYDLYVKNDISKCRDNLEAFMDVFEKKVPELTNILKDINRLKCE